MSPAKDLLCLGSGPETLVALQVPDLSIGVVLLSQLDGRCLLGSSRCYNVEDWHHNSVSAFHASFADFCGQYLRDLPICRKYRLGDKLWPLPFRSPSQRADVYLILVPLHAPSEHP